MVPPIIIINLRFPNSFFFLRMTIDMITVTNINTTATTAPAIMIGLFGSDSSERSSFGGTNKRENLISSKD